MRYQNRVSLRSAWVCWSARPSSLPPRPAGRAPADGPLSITHNAVVLERGSVIHSSTAAGLLAQDDKIDTLLAVSQH
jgi:hypothetical protein